MTYTPEQLRESELQNELLLDNAATCSQHPALEEPTVRECIVLNIVNPLRVAYAWAADEMDAYKDAAEKRMNERDAALEELAALRAQLAERDAEIARLKAHAVEPRIGLNSDGSLDEVVGSPGHIEQLDSGHWFVEIGEYAIWLHAKGKIVAHYEHRAAYPKED